MTVPMCSGMLVPISMLSLPSPPRVGSAGQSTQLGPMGRVTPHSCVSDSSKMSRVNASNFRNSMPSWRIFQVRYSSFRCGISPSLSRVECAVNSFVARSPRRRRAREVPDPPSSCRPFNASVHCRKWREAVSVASAPARVSSLAWLARSVSASTCSRHLVPWNRVSNVS